jgi:alkanesulfonate monooxygenase SsuD/methylene tetrahydromethanopterin reductase-like flavin-dependent oxidoreductase (luciferase family)
MTRFGVYCANFGALGEAKTIVELACAAEQAGWDGFFVYDHIVLLRDRPVRSVDPWTVLAVIADRTELTLGPLITPVARRQPWELAHQATAIERLSGGRLILGVGLGEGTDYEAFGDTRSLRERADRLDEGLELLGRLWSGEAVQHSGSWRLDNVTMIPTPTRRIPIWVAGRLGATRPVRRAARFDGFFPISRSWDVNEPLSADGLGEMVAAVRAERGSLEGFEIVTAGVTPADGSEAAAVVAPYSDVGATWWLETIEPLRGDLATLRKRIEAGPPAA